MMRLLVLAMVLATCAGARTVVDLGARRPDKPPAASIPDVPGSTRQGGDTMVDATVITELPFTDTGTTTGFADDYDEACPFTGSTSPDVVYAYTPPMERVLTIDMYGSAYDTKIYVYDQDLDLVACNDDHYPDYVSLLQNVRLDAGVTYFLVIDGWNGDHGQYVLNVTEHDPCELEWPPGAVAEGEPPLQDGYLDAHNGGCNSPEFDYPFQELHGDEDGNLVFCGVAGWYEFNGASYRDTDWFHLHAGSDAPITVTVAAEQRTIFTETHQWCSIGPVIPPLISEDCELVSGTIEGYAPGGLIWFFVAAGTFAPPWPDFGHEYDYVIWFTGLMPAPVATETATWTTVKSLFR